MSDKSLLSELCQKLGLSKPEYYSERLPSPDHQPIFKTHVAVNKVTYGHAKSIGKKKGEHKIAKYAYQQLVEAHRDEIKKIKERDNKEPNWNKNLPKDVKIEVYDATDQNKIKLWLSELN